MASIDLQKIHDSGEVDIVRDYSWAVSNSKLFSRKEVPYIQITEFQQSRSSILQSIEHWWKQGTVITTGQVQDPYSSMYAVDMTNHGNIYIMPFYTPYNHVVTNAWGEGKGVIGDTARKVAEVVTEVARAGFPSAGIESAKSFEGTGIASYTFTFQLLNTVNPSVDIQKNIQFIRVLINNNLIDRIDFIASRPPAICEITIPGIRGTTVGVMSSIIIENIGQINYMRKYGGNIPDAFQISISIQELLTESRQIYNDDLKEGKVFSSVVQSIEGIQGAIDTAKEKLEAIDAAKNNPFGGLIG